MGVEDIRRQAPNVLRMKLLGAEVVPVDSGAGTLKDAMNEAMRYWVGTVEDTHYVIGSVAGPHPYPMMVRDFQKIIGEEVGQMQRAIGRLPDMLIACVGGGSNAMGLFYPFLNDPVELVGVEAARQRGSLRGDMRRPWARVRPACSTGPNPTCFRTERPDQRGPFRLRRTGLSGGRP